MIWYTKNIVHSSWTCGEPVWLTNPRTNKWSHNFFVLWLSWTIFFFSQHTGSTNANIIFLWFLFVFGFEHYFELYMDCIEVYLYFNHNYNLVFSGLEEKSCIFLIKWVTELTCLIYHSVVGWTGFNFFVSLINEPN